MKNVDVITIPESFILTVSNESIKSLFPWSGSNKNVCKEVEKPWADKDNNWGVRPEYIYEIEAKIFSFEKEKRICQERIISTMKSEGFVPGNLRHLLSIREQFSNLIVPIQIVALDSTMTFNISGTKAVALAASVSEDIAVKLTHSGINYYSSIVEKAVFLGVRAESLAE